MDEYLPDIPLEEPAHPDLHPDGPLPFDLPAQNQEQAQGNSQRSISHKSQSRTLTKSSRYIITLISV